MVGDHDIQLSFLSQLEMIFLREIMVIMAHKGTFIVLMTFSSLMIITVKTKSLVVTGGMLVMIGRGLVDIIANGF